MDMHAAAALAHHVHCQWYAGVGRGEEAMTDSVGDARQTERRELVVAFVPDDDRDGDDGGDGDGTRRIAKGDSHCAGCSHSISHQISPQRGDATRVLRAHISQIWRQIAGAIPVRIHLAGMHVGSAALEEGDSEVADAGVHEYNVTFF